MRCNMRARKWLLGAWLLIILLAAGCSGALENDPAGGTFAPPDVAQDTTASAASTENGTWHDDADSTTPYVVLTDNQPDFSEEDKKRTDAFEIYSELDTLGRCGQAYANICKELMPTEPRQPIGQVRPSGWHTVKYNDLIDGNYLYNRCHLIGYQLAGENANERNLITGTRYLNVMGMLPVEDTVAEYVQKTGNHVLYRVTPVFEDRNLVASGVQIEAWSVEDQGAGICYNIYCYNVQPGITIDYLTGDSQRNEDADIQSSADNGQQATQEQTTQEQTTQEYIINTNTKKFHIPSCSSVQSMSEHNKKIWQGSMETLKEQGYLPCKRCIDK